MLGMTEMNMSENGRFVQKGWKMSLALCSDSSD
jgi:hypothetical protein